MLHLISVMPLIVPTMSDASTNISKRDAPCVPGMRASVGPGMCDASIGPGKNNASLRLWFCDASQGSKMMVSVLKIQRYICSSNMRHTSRGNPHAKTPHDLCTVFLLWFVLFCWVHACVLPISITRVSGLPQCQWTVASASERLPQCQWSNPDRHG